MATGKDCVFEWETHSVLLVVVLVPHISGKVFANERFSAFWEYGETRKIFGLLKVGSSLYVCGSGRCYRTSKLFLSGNHSFNSVVHVLDESNLRSSESTSVGDVIDVVVSLGVFSMGSTDLDVVLVCNCLEFVLS